MQPSFYYPIKPYQLNQGWGVKNPIYEQFGFSAHNGIDYAIGIGKLVCAPFAGTIYQTGNQPNGGGIYFGFLSDDTFTFPDGVKARVLMDFLHLEKIIGKVGVPYGVGDELAIQDNTGFSTGPHTHIQPRRVRYDGKRLTFIDKNDANGSFDPTPYWNGKYSLDERITLLKTTIELLKKVVDKLIKP